MLPKFIKGETNRRTRDHESSVRGHGQGAREGGRGAKRCPGRTSEVGIFRQNGSRTNCDSMNKVEDSLLRPVQEGSRKT